MGDDEVTPDPDTFARLATFGRFDEVARRNQKLMHELTEGVREHAL